MKMGIDRLWYKGQGAVGRKSAAKSHRIFNKRRRSQIHQVNRQLFAFVNAEFNENDEE